MAYNFYIFGPVCRKPHKTEGVCYIESLKTPPVPRKEIYEWDVGRQYSHTRGTTGNEVFGSVLISPALLTPNKQTNKPHKQPSTISNLKNGRKKEDCI
jgi:hypothetical protein